MWHWASHVCSYDASAVMSSLCCAHPFCFCATCRGSIQLREGSEGEEGFLWGEFNRSRTVVRRAQSEYR